MFKNALYITEIALSDFLQLDITLSKCVIQDNKYTTIDEKAADFVQRNIDFYKSEGYNNVVLVKFKGDSTDDFQFIKYYTRNIQNYVVYPGCDHIYRKRNNMTFTFENGECFSLSMGVIDKIYLIHI